jgi:hypothetical protein
LLLHAGCHGLLLPQLWQCWHTEHICTSWQMRVAILHERVVLWTL